jgi:hypothetical protein
MRRACLVLLCSLLPSGCLEPLLRAPSAPAVIALPGRREFRQGQIVYHSDAEVATDHPLFAELANFPEHVCRTLELPATDRLIHVYLFRDRASYEAFFQREFKDLPSRRALFVMKRDGLDRQVEPRIYAFWGERIHDDLRHELTHATLHGLLAEVPLWLDEGLAMYFETGIATRGRHARALDAIAAEMNQGRWRPDVHRLANLDDPRQLHLADYHEVWAWVHFLLHSDSAHRNLLLAHLQELRRGGEHSSLTSAMEAHASQNDPSSELLKHLRTLMADRSAWPH